MSQTPPVQRSQDVRGATWPAPNPLVQPYVAWTAGATRGLRSARCSSRLEGSCGSRPRTASSSTSASPTVVSVSCGTTVSMLASMAVRGSVCDVHWPKSHRQCEDSTTIGPPLSVAGCHQERPRRLHMRAGERALIGCADIAGGDRAVSAHSLKRLRSSERAAWPPRCVTYGYPRRRLLPRT
jgi:hypothetical protein